MKTNKSNNVVKFLVPVVAVLVLAESVLLISNLDKKNKGIMNAPTTVTTPMTNEKTQDAVYSVAVGGAKEMKLNQTGTIEVSAVGNVDKFLDSVNVYLKYDPIAFDVSSLTFDKKLGKPTFTKISTTTGLLVANFLISDPAGLKVSSGDVLSLMKFSVKPIKTGVFSFEVSTGGATKEAETMFVESATSKILPFTSSILDVSVSR